MFSGPKVTEIYCMADDFCKKFAKVQEKYVIEDWNHKQRSRPNRMSDAEIMLILVKKPTIDVCFVKDGQLDIFGFILNSR